MVLESISFSMITMSGLLQLKLVCIQDFICVVVDITFYQVAPGFDQTESSTSHIKKYALQIKFVPDVLRRARSEVEVKLYRAKIKRG